MENYFNYFTEIEEHFQRRRGTILLLSTLDWALIETWKDAGIALEAVLRGIDAAFDKYDRKPSKSRKVNSLAYCSQEVMASAEEMKEAAVGGGTGAARASRQTGMEAPEVIAYLRGNAATITASLFASNPLSGSRPGSRASDNFSAAKLPATGIPASARETASACSATLNEMADKLDKQGAGKSKFALDLEDLERHLTVLEEKLVGAFLAATPDEGLLAIRREADAAIAPYRSKIPGPQIEQLHKQFIQKRLLQQYSLPRLSLFYM